mgnify:CR=1 FL=1
MESANTFDLPDDLDAVLADVWQRLGRAAKDRRAAMHTPVVATVTEAGLPSQRVMVLRSFDRATATLPTQPPAQYPICRFPVSLPISKAASPRMTKRSRPAARISRC